MARWMAHVTAIQEAVAEPALGDRNDHDPDRQDDRGRLWVEPAHVKPESQRATIRARARQPRRASGGD